MFITRAANVLKPGQSFLAWNLQNFGFANLYQSLPLNMKFLSLLSTLTFITRSCIALCQVGERLRKKFVGQLIQALVFTTPLTKKDHWRLIGGDDHWRLIVIQPKHLHQGHLRSSGS